MNITLKRFGQNHEENIRKVWVNHKDNFKKVWVRS